MKRKLTTVEEFFKDDLDTLELKQAYRNVLDTELGEVLRSLRLKSGLTQEQLSVRLGVHRSRIAQIEGTDGLSLTLETLVRFATAMNYRVSVSFSENNDEIASFSLSETPLLEETLEESSLDHPFKVTLFDQSSPWEIKSPKQPRLVATRKGAA